MTRKIANCDRETYALQAATMHARQNWEDYDESRHDPYLIKKGWADRYKCPAPWSTGWQEAVDALIPEYLALWDERHPKSVPASSGPVRYFLTFTVDPTKGVSHDTFEKKVFEQCERWGVFTSVKMCFEHKASNYHAHVDGICPRYLWKGKNGSFKGYISNVGNVHWDEPVTLDRGIGTYMAKEADIIYCCDNNTHSPQWSTQKRVASAVVSPNAPPGL